MAIDLHDHWSCSATTHYALLRRHGCKVAKKRSLPVLEVVLLAAKLVSSANRFPRSHELSTSMWIALLSVYTIDLAFVDSGPSALAMNGLDKRGLFLFLRT